MAFPNIYHHRRVAEGSAKACWICYKPSTSVLITPDNKVDPKPDAEEAAAIAARKKKEDLDREIELVKKEYEEKQKLKRDKRKEKEKSKDKDKDSKKKNEEEDAEDEKTKDDKIKELSKFKDEATADLGPRIYILNKNFYQMRIDKMRNAEAARRNRERLKNPSFFPSVPSGDPS